MMAHGQASSGIVYPEQGKNIPAVIVPQAAHKRTGHRISYRSAPPLSARSRQRFCQSFGMISLDVIVVPPLDFY